MPRIIFLDPQELEHIEPIELTPPDRALVRSVDKANRELSPDLQLLVIQKVKLGMTSRQIAQTNQMTVEQVTKALYEAKRQLKIHLAGFVFSRWGIKSYGICRICGHPQQETIDKMLCAKRQSESWGSFNRRLLKRIGERFVPPRILIAHLNHIKIRKIKNESR